MTATRQKKSKKLRAKTTHGYGSKKKHRGAGNRGGRGMAGTGKRADQKKSLILKKYGKEYFGKHGFKRPLKLMKKGKTINLNIINLKTKEGDTFDATKYDKVLGSGNLDKKIKIKANSFSKNALEKIKKSGSETITNASAKESVNKSAGS